MLRVDGQKNIELKIGMRNFAERGVDQLIPSSSVDALRSPRIPRKRTSTARKLREVKEIFGIEKEG